MRFATIDVGTNTAQLLVAEEDGAGLRRLHVAERFVRLGEEVDAQRRIAGRALHRLLATLDDHLETARSYEVDTVSVAGTSALRDARNRDEIVDTVRDELGLSIEILTGPEEAAWSFAAACSAFESLTGPCLVVDVGGGSTELVAGETPSEHHPNYPDAIVDRVSLDAGCVRLTERFISSHPPSAAEIDTVQRFIDEVLSSHSLDLEPKPALVTTAGTATALALVHRGPKASWDALGGDGFRLSRSEIRGWRERLLQLSLDDILALHPDAMDGRADVFPVGVLLLDQIMAHYHRETCRISPYELRHGLALRALASAPGASTESSP